MKYASLTIFSLNLGFKYSFINLQIMGERRTQIMKILKN